MRGLGHKSVIDWMKADLNASLQLTVRNVRGLSG